MSSASTTAERGRTSRTPGHYDPGMFAGVETVEQFAQTLEVPQKSIPLIASTGEGCKEEGCPFNSIKSNQGYCPAHKRCWYPLKGKRGEDLHGPDFTRWANDGRRGCDCNQVSCKSAGYFPLQDALYVPVAGISVAMATPNLLSSAMKEKLELQIKDPKKESKLYLYAWHFFPEHREKGEDGKWKLKIEKDEKYYDLDRQKIYTFPPPRAAPLKFIDEEFFSEYVRPQDRWAQQNANSKMPTWLLNMLALDAELDIGRSADRESPAEEKSIARLKIETEIWRARALFLQKEKMKQAQQHSKEMDNAKEERSKKISDMLQAHRTELSETLKRHDLQLSNTKEQHGALAAEMKRGYEAAGSQKDSEIRAKEELIKHLENEKARLKDQLDGVQVLLAELQSQASRRPLRYNDLYPGGLLAKHVKAFTFFKTVATNDLFLEVLNYADGSTDSYPAGDGLCENLRPYSHVERSERNGETESPSMQSDSEEYKKHLARSRATRRRTGMTWKDDYLAFCIYVRGGTTQELVACLMGISTGHMCDVFHEWATVLDDALCRWFPRPTRIQMLRAYPRRFLEADGHARCYLLLDAFEIFTQTSSNPGVASSTHSDYKKHCTVKFLGGTDPIGCPWNGTIPDGNPGRASDVIMTSDTNILRQIPFGGTSKVDKGFIVDNDAIAEGVTIDRPQKRLKKQVQQSTVDTSQTQKIGNTRIIVENVNGELKLQIRYLNVLIPCTQFPIISKIVRIGFLLQNFKKAIIQNNTPGAKAQKRGRPCRAAVRWYGANDDGLVNVLDNVRLWGLQCEVDLHSKLSQMEEHKEKTPEQISEIVLDKRLDVEQRREMYRLQGKEYEGRL